MQPTPAWKPAHDDAAWLQPSSRSPGEAHQLSAFLSHLDLSFVALFYAFR